MSGSVVAPVPGALQRGPSGTGGTRLVTRVHALYGWRAGRSTAGADATHGGITCEDPGHGDRPARVTTSATVHTAAHRPAPATS